jgi:hypothetical protein
MKPSLSASSQSAVKLFLCESRATVTFSTKIVQVPFPCHRCFLYLFIVGIGYRLARTSSLSPRCSSRLFHEPEWSRILVHRILATAPVFAVKADPAAGPAVERHFTSKHGGVWQHHGSEGQRVCADWGQENGRHGGIHYRPSRCSAHNVSTKREYTR